MRIEEKCGCGGSLKLVETTSYQSQRADADARVRDAWKQVDRWRRLHAGCRSHASAPPLSTTSPLPPPMITCGR